MTEDNGENIWQEVYVQRVLVFLEEGPQSNKYRQVLLNSDQFKRVTAQIGRATGEKVRGASGEMLDETALELSEEIYVLPDLIEIHD